MHLNKVHTKTQEKDVDCNLTNPKSQIITSMHLPQETQFVTLLASTTQAQTAGARFQRLALRIPKIDAYFTGTGASCTYCALHCNCIQTCHSICYSSRARSTGFS
jgi:hypothetical protein